MGRIAEIGQAVPPSLPIAWVSHDAFKVDRDIRIVDFNGFDIPLDANSLKAEVRDESDKVLRDVSSHLKPATRYDAILDVSAGSGIKFTPDDRTILIKHHDRLVSQLTVTWGARPLLPPPPPKITSIILHVGTTWDDKDTEISFLYDVWRERETCTKWEG